jgi:PAS domain S-box-containing protein
VRTYLLPRSTVVAMAMRSPATWDRRCIHSKESLTIHPAEGLDMKAQTKKMGSSGNTVPPSGPTEQEAVNHPPLTESEDRFQKLFLSTRDAILITDSAAAQFLDVNLQACAMLGYSRAELLNLPPTRILARKEDLSGWIRNTDKKPQHAAEFKHKSGATIPCHISVRPIEFTQKPCFLVVVYRATERQIADTMSKAASFTRFLNAVSVGVAQAPTIEHAIRFCIQQISDFLLVPLAHARLFAERIINQGVPPSIWHFGISARPESRNVNPSDHWHQSEDWYSRVLNAGHPFTCEDLSADPDFPGKQVAHKLGIKSVLVVPVLVDNEVAGVLEFFSYQPIKLEKLRLEIIASMGGRVGRIIEHKRAESSIQTLSSKLFRLQDDERRRLAKELHDTTSQNLAAIVMDLGVIARNVQALDVEARTALSECISLARQSLHEVRTFSYLLHPPMLDELGLVSALRVYIEGFSQRSGMRVDFVASDYAKLSTELEVTLFHVVQEGLTNAHRHSGSPWVKVRMMADANEVRISVENETTAAVVQKMGVGIRSMQERVQHFGGRLVFRSDPYRTLLEAVLPFSRTAKGTKL